MLVVSATKYRRSRQPLESAAAAAVAPLTLVTATYTPDMRTVALEFDRAVAIGGADVTRVVVQDGWYYQASMTGTGTATLSTATTVVVTVAEGERYAEDQVVLDASGATGIVAVNDGGTWAGGTGLAVQIDASGRAARRGRRAGKERGAA